MRSMPRSRREISRRSRLKMSLVFLFAVAWSSGCTLFAGEPWGEADLTLDVRFAPSASRLTAAGALKTAKDYAVVLEKMRVGVREIDLVMSDGGEGALSFDPANPPPAYSLCHNGHCHHDDGRLVSYEDIEIELAGGSASGRFTALRPVRDAELDLLVDGPVVPALETCLDGCLLPRGAFVSSGASVTHLVVEATVFDLRPLENARLPATGTALSMRVPIDARIETRLEGAIDDQSSRRIEIALHLEFSETAFDPVDFGALLGSVPIDTRVSLDGFVSVTEGVRAELLHASTLTADVVRPEDALFDERELVLWNP